MTGGAGADRKGSDVTAMPDAADFSNRADDIAHRKADGAE